MLLHHAIMLVNVIGDKVKMSDSKPTQGPNAAPTAPEGAKVFGYDVSQQARKTAQEVKPNTASPLAAG